MQVINSKNNELVKLVKKLHYKRYRSAYGLFILEGILNFEEILGKSSLLDTAIFSETVADDLYKEFIKQSVMQMAPASTQRCQIKCR